MSTTQLGSERATASPNSRKVDMKLEVVVIPVSNVDRAKHFYLSRGPQPILSLHRKRSPSVWKPLDLCGGSVHAKHLPTLPHRVHGDLGVVGGHFSFLPGFGPRVARRLMQLVRPLGAG